MVRENEQPRDPGPRARRLARPRVARWPLPGRQSFSPRCLKLPVTFRHAERVAELPPHHHDPFDRMLVAQAEDEELILVTLDPDFARY